MQQSTTNAGGELRIATSYRLEGSLAQETTIGASSSFNYILQSGFWSFVGSGVIPVILTMTPNATDPGDLDLSWSGNNPPYQIYMAEDCSNIFGGFYGNESSNSVTVTPPAGDLTCFRVLPTAPGPKQ